MTAEFRSFAVPLECLLKADLKICHVNTATLINVNIWVFWIWSSFSMDSWSSGLEGANLPPHLTEQIRGSIYVALKHFLQHSYNFQHVLCSYYLSLWANASFAVWKLCDFEIETEVPIRLGTDVLCGLQYCCKYTEKQGCSRLSHVQSCFDISF